MSGEPDLVRRSSILLLPDACRVIVRPFLPGHELPSQGISRADEVVERLVAMPESDVEKTLAATLATFSDRHLDLRASFREHYQLVAHRIPASSAISSDRAELIGAYLTHEYSIEAAALFNPSIAAHPDQSGLASGELRFVMTARAVGEGHVSSQEFRTGTLAANDVVRLDEAPTRLTTGRMSQTSMSTQFLRDALDEDVTPSRRRACSAGCRSSSPRRSSRTCSRRSSSTAPGAPATTGFSSASAVWLPAATS